MQTFAYAKFSGHSSSGRMPTFRPDATEGFAVEDEREWALPGRDALESRRENVRRVLIDLDQLRAVVGVERNPVLIPEPRR